MPAELTDDGLVIQTVDEVKTELFTTLRDPDDGFGPDFVVEEHEAIPMVVAILAEREARVQALAKAVLDARVPGSARGVHADNVAAITGTEREAATFSSVAAELHGVPAATITTGRIVRHNPTETLWETIEDVLLDGSGDGATTLRAQTSGPIEIVASTSWSIITGDANLTSVESTADSVPGSLVETDAQLEERRIEELSTPGKATAGAIRANLQQDVDGLNVAAVFVNDTHLTDSDGVLAFSIEVLVDDGGLVDDEVIARAIWANISAGTRTLGNVLVTFVDDLGQTRRVRFSRATAVTAWLRITLDTTGAEVELGDEAALATAIAAAVDDQGDAQPIGRDVIPVAFVPTALALTPAGSVVAVTVERSTDGLAWSTAVLSIAARERAVFAPERVIVQVTP